MSGVVQEQIRLAIHNRQARFVIDWSQTIPEPPKTFQRYVVSFYAKMPNERLIYVVIYEFDPATEHGCVYLPGRADEWYRLNVSTMLHGTEGNWFRASEAWDNVARPLIVARVRGLEPGLAMRCSSGNRFV